MTSYIKLSTLEYPRHEGDIRLEHPEIGNVFHCPATYAQVVPILPPSYANPETEIVYEDKPELIDGIWYMRWIKRLMTEQELEEKRIMEEMRKPLKTISPNLDVSGEPPSVIE